MPLLPLAGEGGAKRRMRVRRRQAPFSQGAPDGANPSNPSPAVGVRKDARLRTS